MTAYHHVRSREIAVVLSEKCPKAPSILSAAKGSCDKLVAHMTAERRDLNFVPGKEHRWQVDLIEDELREVLTTFLDTFLRHAPNDRFDPKALAELQKMKQPRTARGQIPPANATGATGPGPPFAREQIPPANATGATDPGPPLGFGFWE